MKTTVFAIATVAALTAAPLVTGAAKADPTRLAQVDVEVGAPGRPGVVIEHPRRHGVVIESEGRARHDCRSVTVREWRHGARITRTERRCD
jgi:hypothetical protein